MLRHATSGEPADQSSPSGEQAPFVCLSGLVQPRHLDRQLTGCRQAVANHLVRTVDASRLMGASVIITGVSPKIAETLVTIGVDLRKMNTIGAWPAG
jgi:hypothetical protein